jgi:flavin-dependent dehydrogenase
LYDAIIVGARCAGSPLAMLLAKRGRNVLLVDRDGFPSDTLSTAYMQPEAVERLDAWGLLEKLEASGCKPHGLIFSLGGMQVPVPFEGYRPMSPRRTYLDKILVDAARDAGAEVREGFSVRELTRDAEGRVTGVRGQGKGAEVIEQAGIVVGADGRNSFVAKAVQAEEYDVHPPTSVGYYSFWEGTGISDAQFNAVGRRVYFAFPSHHDQVCIAIEAPAEEFAAMRQDTEGFFKRETEANVPEMAKSAAAGKRIERFFGMSPRPAFYRKPYGPGWALVGDAGLLKDPVLGSGIEDAFRDAELLAEAIDTGLSGRQDPSQAMAFYEKTRNEASKPIYDLCAEFAQMNGVTEDMFMRLAALDRDLQRDPSGV